MMFRNHLVVTTAVAVVILNQFELSIPSWLAIGCIFFASILPDLDHPSSTIGSRLLVISLPLSAVFGHRQITHSIWPFIAVWYLVDFDGVAGEIAVLFMAGYFSHLLGDLLSDSGVPILWPIQKRVGLKMCTTGGFIEYVIAYGLLALTIVFYGVKL